MVAVSSPCACHVYLSYRGTNTCLEFIYLLHRELTRAGFQTFKKHNQLDKGKIYGPEWRKAVKDSRVSIVVFSKDYAYSRRCLDELVNILERKKNAGHMILPVFYNVDPSHVRKQTGCYADAFLKYEEQCVTEMGQKMECIARVKKWRASLKEAADLAGMVLEDRDDLKFIQDIVEEIWHKLSRSILNVAPHPVGMYPRVKEISLWLEDRSSNSHTMMICGEAGIGKTTMARALFKLHRERFEYSSFLENIREITNNRNGLVHLQRHLLNILEEDTVELRNVDEGVSIIQEALCYKRFLIVLDDVDQIDQLNAVLGGSDWFASGSKVIVTSRNENLLNPDETNSIYKVKGLDTHESLKLFCWHAFRQEYPVKGYTEQSKRLVQYCRGLPLALQVLGTSLSGGSVDFWESKLEELERLSNCHIHRILEMSYEALPDDHEKNLFLDIACFFAGKDKDYTVQILDGCDYYTTAGIQNLVERCLLAITPENKLIMHQLLQETGKDIVCRESITNAGNRSRIWQHNDSLTVLREETGTEFVEGLVLKLDELKDYNADKVGINSKRPHCNDVSDPSSTLVFGGNLSKRHCLGFCSWIPVRSALATATIRANEGDLTTRALSRMHDLRLLELYNVRLSGVYDGFPKKLRWLCWHGFQLNSMPNSIPLDNLVVLEMQNSSMQQIWEGTKSLRSLKVLDVSHSHFLLKTPDFSGLPSLEKLILEDCTSLVKVHDSIGGLHKLSVLNLSGCRSLRMLPKRIGELKSLEVLKLSRCSELGFAKWTDSFRLTYFWSWTWVSLRPKSGSDILELLQHNLRVLDLSDCNLTEKTIPNDLSVLSSLQYLNLSKNPISKLPESIRSLTMLLSLMLSSCTRLQSIPKLPSRLRILNANGCRSLERIANLPNFLKSLDLKLEDCGKLVEVEGIFMLKHIQDMDEMFNIWSLCDIKPEAEGSAVGVELQNSLTSTTTKAPPVQGLYEFGIFSMFLPGSKVPRKFNKKSIGSPISFSIPSGCSVEMHGLNICVVYEQCSEELCGESLYITVSNKSKGIKWIYSPVLSAVTGPRNTVVWLSHWKFGNQMERGDEVIVSPSVKCVVREFGVEVSYSESEEKWIQQHYSSHLHHAVDGDLSVFEMNPDVYLLSLKS